MANHLQERQAHGGAFETTEQALRIWIALQPRKRKPRVQPTPPRKFSWQ